MDGLNLFGVIDAYQVQAIASKIEQLYANPPAPERFKKEQVLYFNMYVEHITIQLTLMKAFKCAGTSRDQISGSQQ